jgi:hypothetical protein
VKEATVISFFGYTIAFKRLSSSALLVPTDNSSTSLTQPSPVIPGDGLSHKKESSERSLPEINIEVEVSLAIRFTSDHVVERLVSFSTKQSAPPPSAHAAPHKLQHQKLYLQDIVRLCPLP